MSERDEDERLPLMVARNTEAQNHSQSSSRDRRGVPRKNGGDEGNVRVGVARSLFNEDVNSNSR
jgi:hypothetical protein